MTESVKEDPVLFTPGTQKRVMHTSKIAKNMNRFKAREEHFKNQNIDEQAEIRRQMQMSSKTLH